MSGLSMLGGVGQGLMQGSQFVQQKRQQDARLGMLEEEQGWKRDDRQAQQAEAQRAQAVNQIYQQTIQELGPETDPLALDTEVFKRTVASGQATKAELEPLMGSVRQLRQRGVTNAIRMGDTQKLGGLLSQQYGRPVQVVVSQAQDEYGQMSPTYSLVGEDGAEVGRFSTPQLGAILGADDLLADEERRLEMRKTGAEIGLAGARGEAARAAGSASRASAGKYSAQAEGERLMNAGLASLPPDQRHRATRGDRDPYSTSAAKEQDMYARMPPEEQQRYRARTAENIRNDLRKSNALEFFGDAGAAKLEREVQRQTDAMLGTAPPAASERDPLNLGI